MGSAGLLCNPVLHHFSKLRKIAKQRRPLPFPLYCSLLYDSNSPAYRRATTLNFKLEGQIFMENVYSVLANILQSVHCNFTQCRRSVCSCWFWFLVLDVDIQPSAPVGCVQTAGGKGVGEGGGKGEGMVHIDPPCIGQDPGMSQRKFRRIVKLKSWQHLCYLLLLAYMPRPGLLPMP